MSDDLVDAVAKLKLQNPEYTAKQVFEALDSPNVTLSQVKKACSKAGKQSHRSVSEKTTQEGSYNAPSAQVSDLTMSQLSTSDQQVGVPFKMDGEEHLLTHNAGHSVKPKPTRVRRPRGLPPLFPGPPQWLANPAPFVRQMGLPANMVDFMIGPYINQRELDERFRHLGHVYEQLEASGEGGQKTPRTLREHQPHFRRAGYDLSTTASKERIVKPYILVEAFEAMRGLGGGDGLIHDGSYRAPVPPLPRRCDYCDRTATAECQCGEAYCDKDCQAADWPNHRDICQTIEENNELGISITKASWKGREIK